MSKDVTLTRLASGPKKWKLTHPGSVKNDAEGYPVVQLAKDSGPQLVIFDLPGGHKFNTHPDIGPIWIGTQKPTSKVIHPQIADVRLFDGGKTLVILDKNSTKVDLHYRLNIKHPNGSPDDLDPIIENGGGTIGDDQPPPPPPPPPPSPTERGLTAGAQPDATPTGFGLVGGIDTVALLMGLVVGFILAAIMFKWGK